MDLFRIGSSCRRGRRFITCGTTGSAARALAGIRSVTTFTHSNIMADKGKPDTVFASKVVERAMQKGLLLVYTGRESIKLGPPLTIPDAALIEGLNVLEESIAEVSSEASE